MFSLRSAFVPFLLVSTAASFHFVPALPAQAIQRILAPNAPAPDVREEKRSDDKETPKAKDSIPLFYLRDRSKVAGYPKLESLAVQTRYGVLSVPVKELVRVRFVTRVAPEVTAQVDEIIARLGSDDFDIREKAMDDARAVGPDALPALRKAMTSKEEEIKNRAEILVDELEAIAKGSGGDKVGESLEQLKGSDDEISTTRMTIRGTILLETIVIGSRYGDLSVAVADLEAIHFQKAGPSTGKFEILPKFQPRGTWFDSKLMVEKGQRFSIEASGLMSVSNYGVSCGPEGTTQWNSGNQFNNYPMLSLVGKVGKNGTAFLVKRGYKGKAKKAGRLYLSIVPFAYNINGVSGKYTAKVKLLAAD